MREYIPAPVFSSPVTIYPVKDPSIREILVRVVMATASLSLL